jgi:hypothetical protein
MRFASLLLLVAYLCSSSARADDCVGLVELQKALSTQVSSFLNSLVGCGSLTTVVKRLMSRKRTSGRRLEEEQPLNVTQAQANANAAMKDPTVRRKLDQARREIPDENTRLAYEAAIFDEEGYYGARDLRIQQLSERLN